MDVTRDEFWLYIAVTLLMGITQKPNFDLYWSDDAFFEIQIFKKLVSRTLYWQLRTIIHFSDPLDFDADDPLKKLRYMVDELSDLYISNYTPKENIIVDEYLSLWKGRLSFRVYIYPVTGSFTAWNFSCSVKAELATLPHLSFTLDHQQIMVTLLIICYLSHGLNTNLDPKLWYLYWNHFLIKVTF